MKSIRGIRREYADPERIEAEKNAWERAVCEKYRDFAPESADPGETRNGLPERLEESAKLYAEIYAEDPERQELAESAIKNWPE